MGRDLEEDWDAALAVDDSGAAFCVLAVSAFYKV